LKIESAPFYILDEFDNALDAEYRGSIAQLIMELSKESQFLVTTFKPELIEGCNKIMEVSYKNGESKLSVIDIDRAYKILDENDEGQN
jgi:structural maintenance of chromosome 3 (chondroitin sulfate proteoglycan 6)